MNLNLLDKQTHSKVHPDGVSIAHVNLLPNAESDRPGRSLVAFRNVCKRLPGVAALRQVSVQVTAVPCRALMGVNGVGKSTLGKILAGP